MYWRCVKNLMGDCKHEPEWEVEPHWVLSPTGEELHQAGGVCKLNHKDCKNYIVK